MSRTGGQIKKLETIKEEVPKATKQNRLAATQPNIPKPEKQDRDSAKKYMPYGFTKLRENQKQQQYTQLFEDFNKVKEENNRLKKEITNLNSKYSALLEKSMAPEAASAR